MDPWQLLRSAGAGLIRALAFAVLGGALLVAVPAGAQGDASRAEALVKEGRYQEAYDLLAPQEATRGGDPEFDYLLGRAALGTNRNEQAKRLLERSLAKRPESDAARLALGRAYYALGMFAEAKIEFETVLQLDNLPPDLESQAEIYAAAAAQYLDEGRRLLTTSFAEVGVGRYRVNSTRGTDAFGGGDRRDTFYNANVGGTLAFALDNGYTLNGSARYEFRYFDNDTVRNDSDVYWQGGASRSLGEGNLAFGVRGRVSYRGSGTYRNDYGVFARYGHRLDEDNQVVFDTHVRRRRYPEGRLRERSRTIAEVGAAWVRSLFDGRGSFSTRGHAGYQYATSRDDGESAIFGLTLSLDYTFTDRLGGFVFAWWERDRFNTDRIHYHPDALDEGVILRRQDNLYEFGGGLVYELAKGWTLRPEILYIRDESNAVAFNYSSTEAWINLRKNF